jgi:hypothetical protein
MKQIAGVAVVGIILQVEEPAGRGDVVDEHGRVDQIRDVFVREAAEVFAGANVASVSWVTPETSACR